MPMTEGGRQRLDVGELIVRALRSTQGAPAGLAVAESFPKLLWLEHPVPAGGQELIWATRLPV